MASPQRAGLSVPTPRKACGVSTAIPDASGSIAAGLVGLKELICQTCPTGMTVQQEHTLRIIENLGRKDLNPIEKATKLKAFVEMQTGRGKSEGGRSGALCQ